MMERAEVLSRGDDSGNNMPFRLVLSSGLEIVGLPTKNTYGGNWDLGPTWNYLVLADRPFLIDTGRTGTGKNIVDMMEIAGFHPRDLDFILLSHGHEDHDGGLVELVSKTDAFVMAHHAYSRLIRFYPGEAPDKRRAHFPPSCWHCFMPEEFSQRHCLAYHRGRNGLKIHEIDDGKTTLWRDIDCYYLPGHSPDALSIFLGSEAVLLGDTILPEITPMPSRESFFKQVKRILDVDDGSGIPPYGLMTYLRSIKSLRNLSKNAPGILPLPGHRLFSHGSWNEFSLTERVDELLQHHLDRCGSILKILNEGPDTARGIAKKHFDEKLLEGFGIFMAENEILSHCELLALAGDVFSEGDLFVSSGSENFQSLISSLNPLLDEG